MLAFSLLKEEEWCNRYMVCLFNHFYRVTMAEYIKTSVIQYKRLYYRTLDRWDALSPDDVNTQSDTYLVASSLLSRLQFVYRGEGRL